MDLNQNQKAIVYSENPAILVVAGPGAGKTTVLRHRIEHVLRQSAGRRSRLLGITFTNVAAEAIRKKLDSVDFDANDRRRIDIRTFHGFAAKILQQHGSHIGLSPDFAIVSTFEDRLALAQKSSEAVGSTGDVRSLLPLLERLLERGATPDTVDRYLVQSKDNSSIGRLLESYLSTCIAHQQLDFPQLVYLCNQLLERFPAIARQIRRVYRFIYVDEFQDTNDAQFRLLELIIGSDNAGLLFLADQDQLIYQWNGASPDRLQTAVDKFGMQILFLPTSFRCPEAILLAANRLISHNLNRFSESTLVSSAGHNCEIVVTSTADEYAERRFICDYLESLDAEALKSTAVLARSRKLLLKAFTAASEQGLNVAAPTPTYEFESAPMVMLHNMLRLALAPASDAALERLCGAFYEVVGRAVDPVSVRASANADAVHPLQQFFNFLSAFAKTPEFYALARRVNDDLIARGRFRELSRDFFPWIEKVIHIRCQGAKSAYLASFEEERSIWNDFERVHRGLESDGVSLREFVQALDLSPKSPDVEGKALFLTVHAAKGLEFQNVLLCGVAEQQFPTFQAVKAGEKSSPMAEERRSFFVAITRCSSRLNISFARNYGGYPAIASRFIGEMELNVSTVM